jgi:hypothetical protein
LALDRTQDHILSEDPTIGQTQWRQYRLKIVDTVRSPLNPPQGRAEQGRVGWVVSSLTRLGVVATTQQQGDVIKAGSERLSQCLSPKLLNQQSEITVCFLKRVSTMDALRGTHTTHHPAVMWWLFSAPPSLTPRDRFFLFPILLPWNWTSLHDAGPAPDDDERNGDVAPAPGAQGVDIQEEAPHAAEREHGFAYLACFFAASVLRPARQPQQQRRHQ